MSAIEIDVPITKWSMLVWKNTKELPKENERVLMDIDGEVFGGRFVCGQFVSKSKIRRNATPREPYFRRNKE